MTDRKKLSQYYKETLEEKMISYLAELQNFPLRQAMDIYYRSRLSRQIYAGSFGIENMDYHYLKEDLIENEPELFQNKHVTNGGP